MNRCVHGIYPPEACFTCREDAKPAAPPASEPPHMFAMKPCPACGNPVGCESWNEAPPTEPLRCKVTGNPCGTDTRPVGDPCKCENCMAAAVPAEATLRQLRQQLADKDVQSPVLPDHLWKQYENALDKAESVGAFKMLKNAEAAIGRWYVENWRKK